MGTSNHLRSIIHLSGRAFALGLSLAALSAPVAAYDLTDKLSLSGVFSHVHQCQDVSSAPGTPNTCRGTLPFQPEISFKPNERNEFFAKAGLAEGDGINELSPFALTPFAADLESDVEDLNGRNRDHLLTAWYKHVFEVREDNTVGVTVGIIDATDYLDDNAFANDEFGQFLNEAFVNAPTAFLPSYDYGGAIEWDHGQWSVRGVVMVVGENDDGNEYTFYGLQIAHTKTNRFGEGTFRVVLAGTSDDFLDATGTRTEALGQVLVNFDQEIGDKLGVFVRVGWQDDDAAVTHDAMYSGGLVLKGIMWGLENHSVGLGYGFLDGGNQTISGTHVAEVYYKVQIDERFSVTADVQYMRDNVRAGAASPHGYIFGVRSTVEY
ncbi:MAG: carbohydrate porin [Methyloligellaceae bacterium]